MHMKEGDEPTNTASQQFDRPGLYRIEVKGRLDARWSSRFDGMELKHESDGTTTIEGQIVDQAALHGLIQRVRDLGLTLVSLNRVTPTNQTSI